MGARENLQKLADKKREEVSELERQLDRATAYLQAIQDSIKALPRENGPNSPMEDATALRPGTLLAKVREALIKKGAPMHINMLLEEIGIENTKNSRVSLVGSLGTYVRRGVIFTRPGPNIFGLIGMEPIVPTPAVSLPEGFGVISEGV